jgi:tripartite-type tricarboxylate transporter receptor subunit TctC
MKKLLSLLLATICFVAVAQPVNTPKKIITSFPVGSGPDVLARKIAENLSEQWKHPVIVDNRPGGNGTIAMDAYLAEAAAPQSIYLAPNDNFTSHPILYNTQKYSQAMKVLSPVFKVDLVLIASPEVADWSALVTAVKQNPSFGSWGVGSGGHIAGLEFADYLGVSAVHVPYRDFSQWFIDVSGKQLSYSFSTVASTSKLEKAGKIKYIAFSSNKRDPNYPNVPTLKELIGRNIGSPVWAAFYIHADTPEATVNKLHQDVQTAIKSATIQETINALNYRGWSDTPGDFEKQVRSDRELFRWVSNKFNITVK